MAGKLTKRQAEHLSKLRKGGVLVCEWLGYWRLHGGTMRRLNGKTEDALRETGELVRLYFQGKRLRVWLIAHRDNVEQVLRDRPNLKFISQEDVK